MRPPGPGSIRITLLSVSPRQSEIVISHASAKGSRLQRLYSIFPNGWPGKGLLLLRLTSGGWLLVDAGAVFVGGSSPAGVVFLCGVIPALLQIVGLWTPIAALAAILVEACVLVLGGGRLEAGVLLILLNASIAMLGPGCWSVDSILFGRRRLDLTD